MNRSETTLGPHVDLISGHAFKSRFFTDNPSDIPLVKGENISQGMILWDKSRYWLRADSDDYEKFALVPGDVVVAMDRPWVSAGLKYAVITERDPEALLVQRVARIRGINGLTSQFLRYVIASPEFCAYVKTIMDGTSVPHISGDQIRAFPFRLPPKPEQQKISRILSAYDDLIENNRRRIRLLEQTARLLYKEWFVHLRFPGHEYLTINNGVPDGWEKIHLSKLVTTQYGFTESATEEPVGPKFLRGMDINKTSYIDWSTVPFCSENKLDFDKYALNVDDIVVIRMADPGRVAIVETEHRAVFASYLVRLSKKINVSIPALYLFYVLSDDSYQGFISGASSGSTRKSAGAKLLVDFYISVPTPKLVTYFVDQVQPLRQQIQKILQQNAALGHARDALLPRLINGEIAV